MDTWLTLILVLIGGVAFLFGYAVGCNSTIKRFVKNIALEGSFAETDKLITSREHLIAMVLMIGGYSERERNSHDHPLRKILDEYPKPTEESKV